MRVAVLHNVVPDDAPPEDQDTLVQVDVVAEALERLGHDPVKIACTLDLATMLDQLRRARPEVVFSLVESLEGSDSLAYLPLAVLDTSGLPYTGSRTEAMWLTTNKILAKERMRQAGLPTPTWMENDARSIPISELPPCSSWIVKGVSDQGSRDMQDDAVLMDAGPAEVLERLREWSLRTGRACFAEQFIDGREFAVTLLAGGQGAVVQSPYEIEFPGYPPDKPRIVGYRAKWREDSHEYHGTPRRFDFPCSDGPLLDQLRRLAEHCWSLFRLRGWARIDFRIDAEGQPWILEVNANPCLSPDAGFHAVLERESVTFDEAIQRILDDAY
jgi:D-alanine-D-alanine ligase